MGALPIILVILAMKIPILGLWSFVWWLSREPAAEDTPEERQERFPREPRRSRRERPQGPRRRGPHGGAAASPPPRTRRLVHTRRTPVG